MAPARAVASSPSSEQALQLRMALLEHCALAGWRPRHLGGDDVEPGLEEALLEVIACREAEATRLAEELLACCAALGWRSPWLDDNRARLLVHAGEEAEAIAIWRRLAESEDGAVRHTAADTLSALANRPAMAVRVARIRKLREREEVALWRPLLLEALLNSPADPEPSLRELLREIALELAGSDGLAWDGALLEQELRLRLYEEQMGRWEQC